MFLTDCDGCMTDGGMYYSEKGDELKKFNAKEFPGLPKNIIFGIDAGGAVRQEISENMKHSNKSLSPIFFISDTFNRVVFLKQGYTISLGEQMEQVIRTL